MGQLFTVSEKTTLGYLLAQTIDLTRGVFLCFLFLLLRNYFLFQKKTKLFAGIVAPATTVVGKL